MRDYRQFSLLHSRSGGALGLILLLSLIGAVATATVGPGPIVSWEPAGDGIDRGPVTALASDPADPSVLFAGAGGQLYRSRNGGLRWDRVGTVRDAEVVVLDELEAGDERPVVDPNDSDELLRLGIIELELREPEDEDIDEDDLYEGEEYVEESELDDRREEAKEALAALWYEQALEDALRDVERAIEAAGYQVAGERVQESEADQRANRRDARVNQLAVGPAGRLILAATTSGLYVSRDGGDSWDRIPLPERKGSREAHATLLSGAVALVGAESGLYRSEDSGRSWVPVEGAVSGAPVRALAAGTDGALLAGTDRGLYRSDDQGRSFRDQGSLSGGSAAQVRDLTALPGGGLLVSTRSGLHRRSPGEGWSSLGAGSLVPGTVRRVAVSPAEPEALLAATRSRVYRYDPVQRLLQEVPAGLLGGEIHDLHAAAGAAGRVYLAAGPRVYRAVRAADAATGAGRAPAVEEGALRAAAVRASGLDVAWTAAGLPGRRIAAWVPELSMAFEYERTQAESYAVLFYEDDEEEPAIPTSGLPGWHDSHYSYSLSLRWYLGGTLFHGDALTASRKIRRQVAARREVEERVVRLNAERLRLERGGRLFDPEPDQDPELLLRELLRYQEVVAQLDGLTGFTLTRSTEQPSMAGVE